MAINIRNMVKKDRPALIKILKSTPEFKPLEAAVAEEVIDSYLSNPGGSGYYIMVADEGSNITGYICYGPTPLTDGTWDIYWQAVDQDKRGQGIGRALTEAAERNIKDAGGRLAIIETSSVPAYEKTRRFHFGNGYEVIGCIPDFYALGDDKLILQKRLR